MNRNIDHVPFARPALGGEEEEAVLRVLRSGWLTTGREAAAFEESMASLTRSPFALAVNSATSGLHLALEALGIGPGDKVITTPWTFTASAEVIRYLGAHPVFADIEPGGFNIDPEEVARLADQPGVKAILPVHFGGLPCAMAPLKALAEQHNLKIIEDAAHSFPSSTKEGYAGTWGDAGVYSFYANKTITTGEGGMVLTPHKEVAERIKILRLHGIDRDAFQRYTNRKASWEYDVVAPGYKYNMPDLAAAIGRVQMGRGEDFLQQRRVIAQTYTQAFEGLDFLECPPDGPGNSWHLYVIRLNLDKLNIDRNQFILKLQEQGISTSVHYKPLHLMDYYKKEYQLTPGDLPRASETYNRVISLPIYHGMTREETAFVINGVKRIGNGLG